MSAATATAVTATEELHVVSDHFGGIDVLAFLVLPLAGLQAALDIDWAAFFQVLAGDLGQAVVEHHPVPFGFLDLVAAVLVFPVARGGDGDVADGIAVGGVAHFGVAPQVADEDDFVD